MPKKPNQSNPPCPSCGVTMRRNGYTNRGTPRYRCKCGKTLTPNKKPPGRPTIGDAPMTQAERDKRRKKKK